MLSTENGNDYFSYPIGGRC